MDLKFEMQTHKHTFQEKRSITKGEGFLLESGGLFRFYMSGPHLCREQLAGGPERSEIRWSHCDLAVTYFTSRQVIPSCFFERPSLQTETFPIWAISDVLVMPLSVCCATRRKAPDRRESQQMPFPLACCAHQPQSNIVLKVLSGAFYAIFSIVCLNFHVHNTSHITKWNPPPKKHKMISSRDKGYISTFTTHPSLNNYSLGFIRLIQRN